MVDEINVVWLALTYNCNNRCSWCYSASNEGKSRDYLAREKIIPVLDFLKDLKIKRTILIGGEPTVYPHLYELLEEQEKRGIPVGMVTNGRRFSDESFAYEIGKRRLKELTVSIEGHDAQTHDSITNIPGSYAEAITGIRNASKQGFNVAVNTVITKNNREDLEKVVDSLINEPITGFSFNICGPCLTNKENNSFLLNPYLAAKSFERVYEYIVSKGKNARLVTPTPLCFFEEGLRESLKFKGKISGGPCQLAHGKNFVIEPSGDIVPCTHLGGFPMMSLFEEENIISNERFLEKYNDPESTPFKFRRKMYRNASSKCDEPNCNEPCSGGCPLFWYSFDPEKEIKGIIT